jgi:hypothetical protein
MRTQKILVLVVLALFTLVSANALAVDEAVEEEILWTRAVVAANRSQRLLNTLKLSDKEIEAFSPVYLDYWDDLNLINDRLQALIVDYSDNYENLTDEKALELLDEHLDIQKDKVALKKKYVKKFKKVLTPKKLVLFYQAENKLDAVIMMELAKEVPLVK